MDISSFITSWTIYRKLNIDWINQKKKSKNYNKYMAVCMCVCVYMYVWIITYQFPLHSKNEIIKFCTIMLLIILNKETNVIHKFSKWNKMIKRIILTYIIESSVNNNRSFAKPWFMHRSHLTKTNWKNKVMKFRFWNYI